MSNTNEMFTAQQTAYEKGWQSKAKFPAKAAEAYGTKHGEGTAEAWLLGNSDFAESFPKWFRFEKATEQAAEVEAEATDQVDIGEEVIELDLTDFDDAEQEPIVPEGWSTGETTIITEHPRTSEPVVLAKSRDTSNGKPEVVLTGVFVDIPAVGEVTMVEEHSVKMPAKVEKPVRHVPYSSETTFDKIIPVGQVALESDKYAPRNSSGRVLRTRLEWAERHFTKFKNTKALGDDVDGGMSDQFYRDMETYRERATAYLAWASSPREYVKEHGSKPEVPHAGSFAKVLKGWKISFTPEQIAFFK